MNEDSRADTLRGLQGLINFLEIHTEIELPDFDFPIYFFGETATKNVKEVAHSLGSFEKSESESYLTLRKKFGGGVVIRAVFTRSAVCTKRVIGTHKVMKDVYPASVQPVRVEVEEDIVEWDCPSLLRGDVPDEAVEMPVEDTPDDEIPF